MRDKFIIMLDLHVLNINFEELFLFFLYSASWPLWLSSWFFLLWWPWWFIKSWIQRYVVLPSVWLIVCDILHITQRSQKHSVVETDAYDKEVTFLGLWEMYSTQVDLKKSVYKFCRKNLFWVAVQFSELFMSSFHFWAYLRTCSLFVCWPKWWPSQKIYYVYPS